MEILNFIDYVLGKHVGGYIGKFNETIVINDNQNGNFFS